MSKVKGLIRFTGLPSGNYTVEAYDNSTAPKYQSAFFNVKVLGGSVVGDQNGIVTPKIPEGQVRAIFKWGSTPSDLDIHLVGPAASGDGDRFHVYYENKTYSFNGNKYVDLDVDDRSSYGPETVTIYMQSPGKYRYFVQDYTNKEYTNSTALADSGAYIEVYDSTSSLPIATFSVPNVPGTLWSVFEYDSETKSINAINSMSYHSTSSTIGSYMVSASSTRKTSLSFEQSNNSDELSKDINTVLESKEK